MAHLHNFAGQAGVVMQNIGNKVKQTAEIAGQIKAIYDIGSFFKNVILPVAEVAAVAL
jgi:hypothetical protein